MSKRKSKSVSKTSSTRNVKQLKTVQSKMKRYGTAARMLRSTEEKRRLEPRKSVREPSGRLRETTSSSTQSTEKTKTKRQLLKIVSSESTQT